MANRVHLLDHALLKIHLARLRDKTTDPETFRHSVRRLSAMLVYEATRDLPLESHPIETPIAPTEGYRMAERIGLIPILRAGLGMVDPALDLVPNAEVWHLGLYRDETTLEPVEYYNKLPAQKPVERAFILDPMLATGGSAIAAIEAVMRWGSPQISLLAIIAAPEGIGKVQAACPDAHIYTCAMDPKLNQQAYIVPGLGDAGDRIFNAQA